MRLGTLALVLCGANDGVAALLTEIPAEDSIPSSSTTY
jgi:hypothetical protein